MRKISTSLILAATLGLLTACDIELPAALLSEVPGTTSTLKNSPYDTDLPDRVLSQKESIALVRKNAQRFELDTALVMGLITQESAFNANALSHAGAMGLMQLMPGTVEHINQVSPVKISSAFDPEQNVAGGTWYLRSLYNILEGYQESERWKLALGAYNGGIGRVTRYAKALGKPKAEITWDDIKGMMPVETQNYVPLVLKHTAYYRTKL